VIPHRSVRARGAVAIAIALLGACGPSVTPVPSPGCLASAAPTASAACGQQPSAPSGSVEPSVGQSVAPSSSVGPSGSPAATASLNVGLGFIKSVQFAPFYLAQQAGYYQAEGLTVTFQNAIDADLVPKVGNSDVDLGLSDGTSVIPAVSQKIPIRYLTTIYRQFPSIVFAKVSSNIKRAADLKGKKIGIPGRYGSSWIMLQALLASAKLTTDDVQIVEYPDFGQAAALANGAVDAATGFVNNEPIQLERSGTPVGVLHIDDLTPLPGPGLIASKATIAAKHDAIAAFVRATLRAMDDIVADPAAGVDASIKVEPTLGENRDLQAAILSATIDAWQGAGGLPLGTIDRESWRKSLDFMTSLGLVPNPVTVDDLVTEEFIPAS
jgi:NitT/TauT family transport system substrate-binding protein